VAAPQNPAVALSTDILRRLVHSLAPDRIILFGSRASGAAHPESDIDLLVVGSWNFEPARLLRYARQLVADSFPSVDLVLCTPEDVAAAKAGNAPFLRSAIESGIVVYQRTVSGPG